MVKLLEARYAKHPSDTKTAMDLADAYLMTEQPAKAQRLYTKVLASDPSNETAKVQLAMALHADGRDAQALALLKGVLQTDPHSQLAHYNLAILYFSEQKSRRGQRRVEEGGGDRPHVGHRQVGPELRQPDGRQHGRPTPERREGRLARRTAARSLRSTPPARAAGWVARRVPAWHTACRRPARRRR